LLDLASDLAEAYPLIGVGPGEFDEAALKLYPPGFAENQWVEPGQKLTSTTIGRVDYSEFRLGNQFPYRRPLPVHNRYMLTLSELGLPGLAIWLWLYVEFIRLAWRCSKLPDRVLSLLGIAGLGVTFAELVYMMVEHFSDIKPLEFVLFVPVLMFAALSSQAASVDRHRGQRSVLPTPDPDYEPIKP
jgi:O-antigen ligase